MKRILTLYMLSIISIRFDAAINFLNFRIINIIRVSNIFCLI